VIQRHREAVNAYIKTGDMMRARQFVLVTTTGSSVLAPTRVGASRTVQQMPNPYRAALMARALEVIRTADMNPIAIPYFDDTANTADIIAENNTSENNKDPSVSGVTLTPVLYDSGTVWSSNMLLSSVGFDLLGYLEPMLDTRIWRREMTAWTTTLLATAVVGKTTATVNGVTYDELLDWQHSIPAVRRYNGVFMVSDGLFRAIRGLKDTTGQPIYQPSLRDDAPDRLLGWPIFVTDALAAPATGVTSGVAAAADGLFIREAGQRHIARYSNIPTHPDQFGIREFAYGSFAFDSAAVRTLKHA
jgi:HK97 family phage major capsid protein